MYKALHSRDDIDRLYVSGKEGGRELASIEDSVAASIQKLEECIKKEQRKTNYSDLKELWQHEDQQNSNN